MTIRQKVALTLDENSHTSLGKVVDTLIIFTIILSVITMILESSPNLKLQYHQIFIAVEFYSIIVFSIEYLLRIWSAPDKPENLALGATRSRINYLRSPMAIIDLLAILPFILSFFAIDLRFLRLIRLIRIFKLTRYSMAMSTLLKVIRREQEAFFSVIFILMIVLVISSSFMYLLEHRLQPEVFGSIPKAMWWSIVTLATVGYGDAVPITTLGKIFGGVIMILGIGIVALPAGILASAFSEQLHKNKSNFRLAVKNALQDGIITSEEYVHLRKLQEEYDLSSEDAEEIMKSQLKQVKIIKREHICPHCGESFNE